MAMTRSHLLTSTMFLHSSSFTNVPTPPVLLSFPHHRSFYGIFFLWCQESEPLHLSFSLPANNRHPPFAFSVLHTPPFLCQIYYQYSSFQIKLQLSLYEFLTWGFLAPPAHLRAARDWGPKLFFASSLRFYWSMYFMAACPCWCQPQL